MEEEQFLGECQRSERNPAIGQNNSYSLLARDRVRNAFNFPDHPVLQVIVDPKIKGAAELRILGNTAVSRQIHIRNTTPDKRILLSLLVHEYMHSFLGDFLAIDYRDFRASPEGVALDEAWAMFGEHYLVKGPPRIAEERMRQCHEKHYTGMSPGICLDTLEAAFDFLVYGNPDAVGKNIVRDYQAFICDRLYN